MQIPIVKNPKAPLPAKLRQSAGQSERQSLKPEGWWELRDLSGSLEGVTRKIEAAADVPEYWKTAIKADLAARCAAPPEGGTPYNFVYLDAHYFVEKGNACLHYTATPDKKLL